MRAVVTTALIAALALLAGCGGEKQEIDHVTLEKAIEVSVARQRHQIVIVACPKGIDAKKGVKFRCTATAADGRQYPFRVVGTDDNGHVRYRGLRPKR
jgi:hypothetical protein